MYKLLTATVTALALSHSAIAAEADIAPVQIEHLAIIAIATGNHLAGNMEIKIRGGFALPRDVNCDTNYVTTRKTEDPDRAMFYMLLKAQLTTQPIRLRIT